MKQLCYFRQVHSRSEKACKLWLCLWSLSSILPRKPPLCVVYLWLTPWAWTSVRCSLSEGTFFFCNGTNDVIVVCYHLVFRFGCLVHQVFFVTEAIGIHSGLTLMSAVCGIIGAASAWLNKNELQVVGSNWTYKGILRRNTASVHTESQTSFEFCIQNLAQFHHIFLCLSFSFFFVEKLHLL